MLNSSLLSGSFPRRNSQKAAKTFVMPVDYLFGTDKNLPSIHLRLGFNIFANQLNFIIH